MLLRDTFLSADSNRRINIDRHCCQPLKSFLQKHDSTCKKIEKGAIVADNCWEYMNCKNSSHCRAYPHYGRACWTVAGTYCQGENCGAFVKISENCERCPWYEELKDERYSLPEMDEATPPVYCWEFWQCGKDHEGDCPAYPDHGEGCWMVAGTLCETKCIDVIAGKIAKVYGTHVKGCCDCPWYMQKADKALTVAK